MSHFDNPTPGTGYQSPLQNINLQNTSQKLLLIEDIADSTTTEVLEIKEQIRAYLKDLYTDIASRSIE